jgi:predicted house-cleaning noncanonical NTP pyrophosphatase (MazG superfamily)
MEKLVRDKVPDVIRETGLDPRVRKVEASTDRRILLQRKIAEESREVIEASWSKDACIIEIADLYEVMIALLKYHDVTEEQMHVVRKKKFQERGGFFEFYVIDVPDLQKQVEISNDEDENRDISPRQLKEGTGNPE